MNLLNQIKARRQATSQLSEDITKKRLDWISKLRVWRAGNDNSLQFFELYKFDKEFVNTSSDFKMYDKQVYFCNTRLKLPTETIFEIDNLPQDQAIKILCEVCLSLIRNKRHFAVFYSEGQRSPHIRIYDFDDLAEVKGFYHAEAQKEFWKSLTPLWVHADKSIWDMEHPVQLEYSLHYKYNTLFDLLFEYIPTPERQETLFEPSPNYSIKPFLYDTDARAIIEKKRKKNPFWEVKQ